MRVVISLYSSSLRQAIHYHCCIFSVADLDGYTCIEKIWMKSWKTVSRNITIQLRLSSTCTLTQDHYYSLTEPFTSVEFVG